MTLHRDDFVPADLDGKPSPLAIVDEGSEAPDPFEIYSLTDDGTLVADMDCEAQLTRAFVGHDDMALAACYWDVVLERVVAEASRPVEEITVPRSSACECGERLDVKLPIDDDGRTTCLSCGRSWDRRPEPFPRVLNIHDED